MSFHTGGPLMVRVFDPKETGLPTPFDAEIA
jgi:hypothetical protein